MISFASFRSGKRELVWCVKLGVTMTAFILKQNINSIVHFARKQMNMMNIQHIEHKIV